MDFHSTERSEPEELGEAEAEAVLMALAGSFFPNPETLSGASSSVHQEPLIDDKLRYQTLLEQIPAVVFTGYMDKGLGEAYVSPHIEAILGFTHREWLEEPVRWYRQIHPDDKSRWSIDAAKFFLTGEPLQAVYRVMSESGQTIWFQCQAKMVRRDDGTPLLVHGVGFDVTELKRTEESLTKALAAAQAATQAKSDFLANMSHEIRTPINGIMGMTRLALETVLTQEQREYLAIVQSSANSLLALVNDILDLSKIEARKLKIEIAEFDPRQAIEEIVRLLAPLAHGKGLELFCYVLSGVPDAVRGDAARFRQIIVNLIGNAIKFTDRGEIVVRADVEKSSRDGVVVHCQISDTGVGIPYDKQESIFDRFSQIDESAKRRHGGAGLGLTICATLAELMGGRVWLESEPGVGSVFHFTLRFEALPSGNAALRDSSRMRGMHVLVVDGSPTGRSILAGMLEDLGCRATCVASQDGARESLSRSEEARDVPSLILADGERKLAVVEPGPAGRRWEERQVCGYLVKPVWRTDLMHALLNHGGASPTPDLARASLAPNPDPVDRGGPRILLAEDNPVNQLVAVSILKKRGHRVQVANNGLEALALAKSERFRVILMDLQMPEMNGLEAVRAIREYEAPSGNYTPVIALTANATASDREKCLAAGMIGHLSKPIIPEKLFEAIEAICGANG